MSQCIWIFILCIISNSVNSMPPTPPKLPVSPKPLIALSKDPMVPGWKDLKSLLQVPPYPEKEENDLKEPLEKVLETLAEKAKDNLKELVADLEERNVELEPKEKKIPDENKIESEYAPVTEISTGKSPNTTIKKTLLNSEILTKTDTAISKSKAIPNPQENHKMKPQDISTPSMVPIFKPLRSKMTRNGNLAIGNQNSDQIVTKNPTTENANPKSIAKNEIKFQTSPNESNDPRNTILVATNCGNLEPKLNGVSAKNPKLVSVDQSKVDFNPNSVTENLKSVRPKPHTPTLCNEESIDLENLLVEALQYIKSEREYMKPVNMQLSGDFRDVSVNAIPLTKTSLERPAKVNFNYVNERSNQNGSYRKITSDNNFNPVSKSNLNQADNAVLILLKPETVSLSEVYGEFLKKLTLTVLVPISLSRL